jgi:hypothetical protein
MIRYTIHSHTSKHQGIGIPTRPGGKKKKKAGRSATQDILNNSVVGGKAPKLYGLPHVNGNRGNYPSSLPSAKVFCMPAKLQRDLRNRRGADSRKILNFPYLREHSLPRGTSVTFLSSYSKQEANEANVGRDSAIEIIPKADGFC